MSSLLLGQGLGAGLLDPVARPLPVLRGCQAACTAAVGAAVAPLSPALSVVCVLSLGPGLEAPPVPPGTNWHTCRSQVHPALCGAQPRGAGPPGSERGSRAHGVDVRLCGPAVCGYFLPISISAFSQQDLSNEQQFLILTMSNSSRLFFFPL